uniref:acetate--CoA ligase n=1 Tax=Setaria digitata TaxID=48799 RepID=A0A915Q756_9BILA
MIQYSVLELPLSLYLNGFMKQLIKELYEDRKSNHISSDLNFLNFTSEEKHRFLILMSIKNLSYECVDAWKDKVQKETSRLYWIGNYYDNEVYDDAELSAETIDILVNKCADVFQGFQLKDKPIVLYLPNLLQLPIAVLAAFRIGLTVLPISATNEDGNYLHDVLKISGANTVITVDGFWMGSKLIKNKEILDTAIINSAVRRVLVVRHVSPDERIPPPHVQLIARRPYYNYKVTMKENRDSWWSTFFPKASISCMPRTVPNNSTSLLLPIRNDSTTRMLSISFEKLEAEISRVQVILHQNEPSLIISTANILHQIICTLAALKVGAIPSIVSKLLIAEEDLTILLDYKEYITFWNLKTLRQILILGSNNLCEKTEEIFGVSCESTELQPV